MMILPFDYGYGSHLPLLIEFVLKTTGPVLELGAGKYSTPILHTLCEGRRLLVTVEHNPDWRGQFEHLKSQSHVITDTLPQGIEWAVALVDSAPSESRRPYIDQIDQHAQYLILHDYGEDQYQYPIDRFRYHRKYEWLSPRTIVVSHFNHVKTREPCRKC